MVLWKHKEASICRRSQSFIWKNLSADSEEGLSLSEIKMMSGIKKKCHIENNTSMFARVLWVVAEAKNTLLGDKELSLIP